MLQSLRIILVLLLVALVPARAIGSVTLSICASDEQQAAAQHQHHESGGGAHATHAEHDQYAPGEDGHACGYCAAHCAGVAFAAPMDVSRVSPGVGADRIPFGSWLEPSVFAVRLDRPPLAS